MGLRRSPAQARSALPHAAQEPSCAWRSPIVVRASLRSPKATSSTSSRAACTPSTVAGAPLYSSHRAVTVRKRSSRFPMSRPTAVIAEDEPLLRGELKDALAELWPEVDIKAEAENGIQAMRALETHEPVVLFLDI